MTVPTRKGIVFLALNERKQTFTKRSFIFRQNWVTCRYMCKIYNQLVEKPETAGLGNKNTEMLQKCIKKWHLHAREQKMVISQLSKETKSSLHTQCMHRASWASLLTHPARADHAWPPPRLVASCGRRRHVLRGRWYNSNIICRHFAYLRSLEECVTLEIHRLQQPNQTHAHAARTCVSCVNDLFQSTEPEIPLLSSPFILKAAAGDEEKRRHYNRSRRGVQR